MVAVLPTCEGAWGCWTIQLQRREIFFARKVEDLKAHNVSFGYSKCHPKATHSIVSPHQKIGEHFSNFIGAIRWAPCGWKQIHSWWAIFQRGNFFDCLFGRSFRATQGVDEFDTHFLMVFQDDFVLILENPPKASPIGSKRIWLKRCAFYEQTRFEMLGAWLLCFEDEEAKTSKIIQNKDIWTSWEYWTETCASSDCFFCCLYLFFGAIKSTPSRIDLEIPVAASLTQPALLEKTVFFFSKESSWLRAESPLCRFGVSISPKKMVIWGGSFGHKK